MVFNPSSRSSTLPEEKSFFSASAENIVLSTMKKCEDDDAVVFRLYEDAGSSVSARMRFPIRITGAQRTNIIEEEGEATPFRNDEIPLALPHHSIETFKVFPKWK